MALTTGLVHHERVEVRVVHACEQAVDKPRVPVFLEERRVVALDDAAALAEELVDRRAFRLDKVCACDTSKCGKQVVR